ncbi:hypothetical protein BDA96_06G263500 [Sorghum bicolor]|uniref:Uncharacterized protein n=2 Tax=Sorghum bicolor TaxID=4558 RepID=A0A921UEA0_SORBI|nr:hypothetical protein BDA96_06G263500 [Sorghum bicolor]OQU82443.1 hypothetical protein SORBI_3006G240650 [Sorghum bicolor]
MEQVIQTEFSGNGKRIRSSCRQLDSREGGNRLQLLLSQSQERRGDGGAGAGAQGKALLLPQACSKSHVVAQPRCRTAGARAGIRRLPAPSGPSLIRSSPEAEECFAHSDF